ncbi:MAG: PAS domain S-box protein [Flavobacteriales bacterium]
MMDIIETKGDVSPFVQIPEGILNLNIAKLLRSEVQAEVRNVLIKAMKERKNISGPLRKVQVNKQYFFIRVECGLIGKDLTPDSGELYLLIIEKFGLEDELSKLLPPHVDQDSNPRIQELEEELALTKEHLQTYIEEIETSNEELQSLNEELQSANEELQSSNEELETTNEELQASNEELQTAYSEIKHINEELSIKENTLRETIVLKNAIFDNTQHANILINKDNQLDLFNREARRVLKVLGVNHPEVGTNFLDILPEQVQHMMEDLIDAAREEGRVVKDLLEVETKSGMAYFEICLTPVVGSIEPVYRSLAIGLLDVTSAKAYESELTKKDKMLMSLLESTSNYLIRTDMEGKYTYVNDAFCEKFGYAREQVIGKYYAPTVHPEDIRECEKAIQKLSSDPHGVAIFQMRKPNPAGGFFNTEWEFVFVHDENGQIAEVQGVGHDITAQTTAFAKLEKERNALELVLWSGRLGSWEWDMERREVNCNAYLMSLLGKGDDPTHISHGEWETWIHPDDTVVYTRQIDETIRGNIGFFEMRLRLKKDADFVAFDFSGKVVERNGKGGAVRLMGVLREVN